MHEGGAASGGPSDTHTADVDRVELASASTTGGTLAAIAAPSVLERAIDRAGPLARRWSAIGVAPGDSEEVRVQKASLTLAATVVTALSCLWVVTYLLVGQPIPAAIPLVYQVVTVIGLVLLARTKRLHRFRATQLALMLTLPFVLQWSLGGYAASSAVSLWALVSVFGALFFYSASEAVPWFMAFVVLTLLSGVADPWLAARPAAVPESLQIVFFVLNVLGVSLTAYLLLQFTIRARDAALAQSEGLLLNVLPPSIAQRLKREPGVIAERYEDVTVLFADVVDFTPFAERTGPERVVGILDGVFSAFDDLTARHRLEKVKTIGDAYMVAGGLPERRTDHAEAAVALALDMQGALASLCQTLGVELELRVGIASGPVVAGVIGRHRFIYDLWGDTVNTASRMESHGVPGRIQVTEATYERTRDRFRYEDRGEVEVKGKRPLRAYLVVGPRDDDGL